MGFFLHKKKDGEKKDILAEIRQVLSDKKLSCPRCGSKDIAYVMMHYYESGIKVWRSKRFEYECGEINHCRCKKCNCRFRPSGEILEE
jgi:hypothetical protein